MRPEGVVGEGGKNRAYCAKSMTRRVAFPHVSDGDNELRSIFIKYAKLYGYTTSRFGWLGAIFSSYANSAKRASSLTPYLLEVTAHFLIFGREVRNPLGVSGLFS
jgi:hypothetical protein